MFRQPLHKRVISRVAFYSGVFLFLWLLDHSQGDQSAPQEAPRAAARSHAP